MVIVLLLNFVVMYAHLFLTSTNDGSTFHFDDDAFREFPQGIPRGQSHVRQRDTPLREERDGTELFARHFSRRRDYDFIATDEFNINEIDDDDDDDDDAEVAALNSYFSFGGDLFVSPDHFVKFNATPAGPVLVLSSLGVGTTRSSDEHTGSSSSSSSSSSSKNNLDSLEVDSIVTLVQKGWNVIDTALHDRQQRGERNVGRALERLCGERRFARHHQGYHPPKHNSEYFGGIASEVRLSLVCRNALFVTSKSGYIPGDADVEDPPRAKKEWIDGLLQLPNDLQKHGHKRHDLASSSFFHFNRVDIIDNNHCISPACLRASLRRSIANIFGASSSSPPPPPPSPAFLDVLYLDDAAEMQLPALRTGHAHHSRHIGHGHLKTKTKVSGIGHGDGALRAFLERLWRAFVFFERARLLGYSGDLPPLLFPELNVTADYEAATRAEEEEEEGVGEDEGGAGAGGGGGGGSSSIIRWYGLASSKSLRVPPSHELHLPLEAAVRVAASAHAHVVKNALSSAARRRLRSEPHLLLHHGLRFVQVPLNLGTPEAATERWQPITSSSSSPTPTAAAEDGGAIHQPVAGAERGEPTTLAATVNTTAVNTVDATVTTTTTTTTTMHTLLEAAALLGVRVVAAKAVGLAGHRLLDEGAKGCGPFRDAEQAFAEPFLRRMRPDDAVAAAKGRSSSSSSSSSWERLNNHGRKNVAESGRVGVGVGGDVPRLLRAWRESVGTKGGGQNNKNKGTRRLQLTRSAPGLTSAVVAHRAPKHVHGNAALSALPRFSPAQFSAMHLECS